MDADLAEIPVEGEEADVSVETEVDTEEKPENTTETDIQEDDGFGSEILPEEEFDSELERAEEENTVDPETGLTLGEVLEQAQEQNLDLMEMEEGETASFIATYASATTDVSVTRGSCYYYSDYDLGSYLTYKYTVSFNNVTATAYCIQPSKSSPGMVYLRLPDWEMERNLPRSATMVQRHPELMVSLKQSIRIFPQESSL